MTNFEYSYPGKLKLLAQVQVRITMGKIETTDITMLEIHLVDHLLIVWFTDILFAELMSVRS